MKHIELENVDNIKDLGVTYDTNLTFSDHINEQEAQHSLRQGETLLQQINS